MSSRPASKESSRSSGSRASSVGRLITTMSSCKRPPSPAAVTVSHDNAEPRGKRCHICSTETIPSGKGLLICPRCRGLQLKSGRMSHLWAIKHANENRSKNIPETDSPKDNYCIDLGLTSPAKNALESRQAWRRLSVQANMDLLKDPASQFMDHIQSGESQPIFAGVVNTGCVVGDRVKSSIRLPRRDRDNANSCLSEPVDEGIGTVTGPGHEAGEIMVKFDYSGIACSMRMDKLDHLGAKTLTSQIERNNNRRRSSSLSNFSGRMQVSVC